MDVAPQQVELPCLVQDPCAMDFGAQQPAEPYLGKDPDGEDFALEQVVLPSVVEDPGGIDFKAGQVLMPHLLKDPGGMDFNAEQVASLEILVGTSGKTSRSRGRRGRQERQAAAGDMGKTAEKSCIGAMEVIAADEVLGCEDEQCENPGAADIGFCESASQPLVLCAECGVSMSVACLACNFANFEAPVEMLREFAYACLGLRGKLRRSQLSWMAARHQSLSSALLQVPIRQHDSAALQASLAEFGLCLMD